MDGLAKASILDINGLTVASGAVTPPLDTYTGAAAGYSVRLLRTAYTGSCMRVREDGGNTETDIGFDSNGDLDTAAIASHCGANNGFIRYWYDQSGNAVDAGQATAGNQMQIYNGTSVITENGKPALQHQDVNGGLEISYTGNNPTTIAAVMANLSGGSNEPIPIINFSSGVPYAFRCLPTGGLNLAYRGFGTSPNSFVNGVEDTDLLGTEVAAAFASAQGLVIGIGDSSGWTGATTNLGRVDPQMFQEVIFWPSDQDNAGNRTGIETNINDYFSIY